MLVQFSVKNYKSIKDKVTLSMVASSDSTHPENTFEVENRNFSLLKSVGIYGANASGKSNILEALGIMRWMVLNSATKLQSGDKIGITPFKLDTAFSSKPSEFEIVFIHNDERYVYGFSVDSEKVHEEWLTAARKSRPRLLFERKIISDGEYKYDFGPSWKGDRKQLEGKTRDNALFLSVAVQFNNPTVQPVYKWFSNCLKSISEHPEKEAEMGFTLTMCSKYPGLKKKVENYLRIADLGIEGFNIEEIPITDSQHWLELPDATKKQIMAETNMDLRDAKIAKVITKHKKSSEDQDTLMIDFDLERDESAGTIRFFAMIGPWLYTLENECVLFVDELEKSIHAHLTRFLIQMVHEYNNDKNPQLIFTTHDCGLLDADLFRRDQIWFTEKDETGATDLYSLWDFKPRKNENYRTGYLKGRYGAVPFIGDLPF
ncbi:ATP-binding protein [bacterium]|nr:ATP-binding protein [bacterium]